MENKKQLDKRLVAVIAVLVLVIVGLVGFLLLRQNTIGIEDGDIPKVGYAANATVMLDQNALQAAMDEAMANAKDGNVSLLYKNHAYSENGTDFSCYIVNSAANKYDMFLTIYADAALTDQIFLSGLVPPGSGFESITLDRALEAGNHTVNVVLTQVDTDENGAQVIKNQVAHTMEFHVSQ